jgi:hypothetical protein
MKIPMQFFASSDRARSTRVLTCFPYGMINPYSRQYSYSAGYKIVYANVSNKEELS